MENNYTPPIFNEYKTRNILSLVERVEVIREYDRHLTRPSLQSLAHKFDCSSKQIKNILINRDSILESYRKGETGPQKEVYTREDVLQKRQEKISFLGKVIYEYIQRMLYFNQSIDDDKVRHKALQIKECIAVENFQPTSAWLEDFKKTYGIKEINLNSLRNNMVITEAKGPHLSAIDMIQYVSRMDQQRDQLLNNKTMLKTYPKAEVNGNRRFQSPNNFTSPQPKIIYKIEEEAEDDELQKLNFADSSLELPELPTTSSNTKTYAAKPVPAKSFDDIESLEETIQHIQALEQYAMLNDNYRAIGLLTQLEQIFRNPDPKD